MTNRKSHTRFRLVPKSTTLDDLEGHYALCFKTHASFGALATARLSCYLKAKYTCIGLVGIGDTESKRETQLPLRNRASSICLYRHLYYLCYWYTGVTVSAFSLVIPVQLFTCITCILSLFLYFVEQINVMMMMMMIYVFCCSSVTYNLVKL